MPISGSIRHLHLLTKTLGLNISAAKQVYNNCKLTERQILKTSIKMMPVRFSTWQWNPQIDDIFTWVDINISTINSKNYAPQPWKRKNEIRSWRNLWDIMNNVK